jgi:serine/threonine protein phosphatase 1
MKISVIPDIHGNLDGLKAVLKAIGPLARGQGIVQLGDFLDRGLESRACVELLMKRQTQDPKHFIVLKGNHEDMLLRSVEGIAALALWLSNGGSATLQSYGNDFERLCRGEGRHAVWLAQRPLRWMYQGVLFCHAGLVANNRDGHDEKALLWSRPPLQKGAFRAVVCGHTPTPSGGIEHQAGVFRCDVGWGRQASVRREYLELQIGTSVLKWERKVF